MAFGKKAQAPAESTPSPSPPAPSAQERLAALLAEQAELESAIASHREERSRLMRESEAPSLGAITALGAQTDQARVRLEWIMHQLPAIQRELAQEQRAAWEAAWETHVPVLGGAQDRLAAAITEFHAALHAANVAHNAARGFGARTDTFVRPFPEESYNRYASVQYLRAVERRRHPQSLPAPEVWLDPLPDLPAAQRFVPHRVPIDEIEAISAIAPPRRVRILHGPVRTANLNIGIARMLAGETHVVSARAAHALVASGCAEYLDEPATTAA